MLDGADDVAKVAATTVDNQSRVEAATGVSAESTPTKLAETPAESARQAVKIRNIPTSLQKDAITNPSFFADGPTRVRASSTSGFGLEIRASNTEVGPFVPVPVEDKGGRAFVNLQQEQFFEILVFNNESFDVGLELRMDGINTMHFAEGATPEFREDGKWLIRAGTQGAAIKGWFINPARVDRFIIKAEPDGVAAELGRPHSIGTIQASFFMARSPGQGPSQFASLFDQTRNAVGRGAPTEFGGTMETRVFESGQSLASIAVIYRNPTPPDLPPADLAP